MRACGIHGNHLQVQIHTTTTMEAYGRSDNSCIWTVEAKTFIDAIVHIVSKSGGTQEYIAWSSTKATSKLDFFMLLHNSRAPLSSSKNPSMYNGGRWLVARSATGSVDGSSSSDHSSITLTEFLPV